MADNELSAKLNRRQNLNDALESGEAQILLRRTLVADGRSRAFVNDQAVSVGLLRQVGDSLVEVQGQFEQRGLLDAATHRGLLDAFGGHEAQAGTVAGLWRAWQGVRDEPSFGWTGSNPARPVFRHACAGSDRFGSTGC